tara:strand:+ start:6095 stop:6391 length:297 start_codon:yes stop_codon:yes gene_type:complete
MNWFDIIKGKYISRKVLKQIKEGIQSVNGVTIDEIIASKNQHLKIHCTYQGEDSPDGRPVKFIITTSGRGKMVGKIKALMRKNVKQALERKDVFIGDW